ncbi:MAG: patatin-like phospholipase family protein [Hyphomonadaceae bacterium]
MAAAKKRINLALQGGGALGAFTWGALDRLLEDERLEVAALSGASAGAMNAVVLADGLANGGPEGARAALKRFWEEVARAGAASPYRRPAYKAMFGAFQPFADAAHSAWGLWADLMTRVASPYDLNPLNLNPLKEVIEGLIDFERVRACDIPIFVSATNVETGRIKVWGRAELSADHLMASACLPLFFQAVEIEGVPYWDGGFMGNPALFPLFETPEAPDILIVQLNPIERKGAPKRAPDIIARINEITFNASLLRELRAIEFVGRLVDEGRLDEARYRKVLVHVLGDDAGLAPFGGADLNSDLEFFHRLHALGHRAATGWLKKHFDDLGARASVDLRAMFEGE